jgi:uncharacterized repeat protein (TIGR01451 family)
MTGIGGVPLVLQNVTSNERLAVVTDASGGFAFHNVPDGDYRLVQAYGVSGAGATPADWSGAAVGEVPRAVTPPISFAANPPTGATDLDCTTPNTLLLEVRGDSQDSQDSQDSEELYICNAPVRYLPIEPNLDHCAVINPRNLITDADFGTMGTFPPGTPANTGSASEPYPDNVPDFTYVLPQVTPLHAPEADEYTVQNIMNDDNSNTIGAWWRIADRTFGNEAGRMMVVNGDVPGSAFFEATAAVKPNTHYLFSVWILNLMKAHGWADPALGVEILDENGDPLYAENLGAQIPVNANVPEWKQVGTVINSARHTALTVRFLSEGPEEIGNDYAIDDIALQEIRLPMFTPRKSCSKRSAAIGETAVYTVILENACSETLTSVTFKDIIPQGLRFVAGSVTINGSPAPEADPQSGFALPDIVGGGSAEVTFEVIAEEIPDVNPTINFAEMSYEYTPVSGETPERFEVVSNQVLLRINPPSCLLEPLALQREQTLPARVAPADTLKFDSPLLQIGSVTYNPDGSIDITRCGTYIAAWFAAAMGGLSRGGLLYELKRFDYSAGAWYDFAGAGNRIKVTETMGFAVISVTDDDIDDSGRVTIGLFNSAQGAFGYSKPTIFTPNSGIMVYGTDYRCIDNRIVTVENDLEDLSAQLQESERFSRLSRAITLPTETQELSGLGVEAIAVGYRHSFQGVGALDSSADLLADADYYLLYGGQYAALADYRGCATIGTLWLLFPDGSANKLPLRFDGSGIYVRLSEPLTLPAGTKFSFTQMLILAG